MKAQDCVGEKTCKGFEVKAQSKEKFGF